MSEDAANAANQVADGEQKPATTPLVLTVHGKTFDVSTEEGRLQHKYWAEALSSLAGKHAQELGEARKFIAARATTSDERELIEKAKSKANEGDIDSALDMVFSHTKEETLKAKKALEVEKENAETWDLYFEKRPELTKVFDRKTIRKVSESSLGIYEVENPFKVLDEFWLPKTSSVGSQAASSQTPPDSQVPPVTLTGGRSATTSRPSAPAPKPDGLSLAGILDSRKITPKR